MPKTETKTTPAGTELITLDAVQDALLNGAEVDLVTEDEVQRDMIRRVLAAESLEEAFGGFHATPAEQFEGIAVSINGIAWLKSAFQEGPKVYALLSATVKETGEDVTISMGGATLLAGFVWAQRNQAMPFVGTFRKENSRANPERAFWTFKLA